MAEVSKREQKREREIARRESTQAIRDPLLRMRELARDPFQLMRDFMRGDPFREIAPLTGGEWWSPDFEVRETKDAYVFKADLPGAKKEDIDISLHGNRLQITGKREETEETREDTYFACERRYGSFARSFTLPDTADTEHIKSELRDGVLSLVIPKKTEAQPRKIAIGTDEKH